MWVAAAGAGEVCVRQQDHGPRAPCSWPGMIGRSGMKGCCVGEHHVDFGEALEGSCTGPRVRYVRTQDPAPEVAGGTCRAAG